MKKLLFLAFLLIPSLAFAVPNSTLSVSPPAVDGTVISASDENTRNNTVTTTFNNHDHNDIDQTANTLAIGDGTAGNKTVTASNADANKPFLRYNDTINYWVFSVDGVQSSVSLSGQEVIFEGVTDDSFQTSLSITDPTADRTQTVQNNSGVIPLGTAGNTLFFTTSGASTITLPTSATIPSGTIKSYSDSLCTVGSLTRDMTATSGAVAYTGVGFAPKSVIFIGNISGSTLNFSSWGVDDGTTAGSLAITTVAGVTTSGIGNSISMYETGTQAQTAKISSLGADGFTLAWTKAGTPSAGTAGIIYMACR